MPGSKSPRVRDILEALDRKYPFNRAASWDNVGLLAGEEEGKAQKILISVDITPRLIERAVSSGYDLIVSHHPLFLDPLKKVTDEGEEGSYVVKILRNGISLICAHTNADLSPFGVSRELALRLELQDLSPMEVATRRKQHKVVVFVPPDDLGGVLQASFLAGAGRIGNYSSCSFRATGTGTFFPSAEAKPHTGDVGTLNSVREERIEFIVDDELLHSVLDAIKGSHPYEEPAIDVYPLREMLPDGWLGIRGELEEEITLEQFLARVRHSIEPATIRYCGDLDRKVKKVGVLGGSGGGFVDNAINSYIDIFLTGDLKHHQVHRLAHSSIIGVDIGHFDSEKFIMEAFKRTIEGDFAELVTVDTFDESTEYLKVYA